MALFKCCECKALQSFPMKNYIGWNLQKFSPVNLTPFTVRSFNTVTRGLPNMYT